MSAEALPDFTLLILVYSSNPEQIRIRMLENYDMQFVTQNEDSKLNSTCWVAGTSSSSHIETDQPPTAPPNNHQKNKKNSNTETRELTISCQTPAWEQYH